VLGQRHQQLELVGGKRARLAVEAHFAGVAVDLQPPEAQRLRLGFSLAPAQVAEPFEPVRA